MVTDSMTTDSTAVRLVRAVRVINVLRTRREVSGDMNIGSNVERMIVRRELEEIEQDIYDDPGPLAAYVPPRLNGPDR